MDRPKLENLNFCTLSKEEFENIFVKEENYIFFIQKTSVKADGTVSKFYEVYKGGIPVTGIQGAGIDFQREGTKIRFGRVPAGGGETVWDEWVDLKGEKGDTPSINDDGNWEYHEGETLDGTTGYVIRVKPENVIVRETGKADSDTLAVTCRRATLAGVQVTLTAEQRAAMMLKATYEFKTESGASSTETVTVKPLEASMDIPSQKMKGKMYNTGLRLELLSLDGKKTYAEKEVVYSYILRGEPGEPGTTGAVCMPVWGNGGTLGFTIVPADSATEIPTVQVVPTISKNGYWVINGEESKAKADVSDAEKNASDALTKTETIEKTVNTLSEKYTSVSQKFDMTYNSVQTVTTQVNNIGNIINAINDKYDKVSSSYGTLSGKMESLELSFGTMNDSYKGLKDGVSEIGGKVEEMSENVVAMDDKVSSVESAATTLKDSVSVIKDDVGNIKSNVNTVKGDVDSVRVDMTEVRANVRFIDTNVNTVNNTVSTIKDDTSNIRTNVNSVKTSVNGIDKKLDETLTVVKKIDEGISSETGPVIPGGGSGS